MGLPSHSKKVVHVLPHSGEHLQLLNSVYLHMGPNMEFGNLCSAVSMCISKGGPLFSCHHRSIFMHPRHAVLWVGKL